MEIAVPVPTPNVAVACVAASVRGKDGGVKLGVFATPGI